MNVTNMTIFLLFISTSLVQGQLLGTKKKKKYGYKGN
jgi:hypothetical protein